MSEESDPDRDAVPEADRPPKRPAPIRSLPAPGASHHRPALAPPAPTIAEEPERRTANADVVRTPRHLYVTVEIPGASKESIGVTATEDHLTIHAKRPEGPAYHFEVDLRDRVDPGSATATYRNGVLDVTLARAGVADASGGESDA